ncbi:MAG: prephenate dehydrogenase [Clostridiales bacterium]|nr:prephenate dehydrogenase [Clostridiales bacterium]
MTINSETRFLIVGLGVMGGSYAKALSRRGCSVSGITLEQKDIDYAVAQGIIARGSTVPDPGLVASADVIVFALYPHTFVEWIERYQHLLSPGALVTDVCGVKTSVIKKIQSILRPDVEFISAHPMAGREGSGIEFSDDAVFRGANYIVTPTPSNTPEAVEAAKEIGRMLGFGSISELTPERHDEIVGYLSQLTHCIAVSLMTCRQSEGMELYTGDSFRDLTRIARINDDMWSELFLLNREQLLMQMDEFENEFRRLRSFISYGDRESMREMMRESTRRRALFDKKKQGDQ